MFVKLDFSGLKNSSFNWIPAFAGMTKGLKNSNKIDLLAKFVLSKKPVMLEQSVIPKQLVVIPVKAGIQEKAQRLHRFRLIFILLSFLSVPLLQAQELETIVKEIELDIDSKKLAQQQALTEVSRTFVMEMLGEKKYKENRAQVEKSIIKNQNRYVLSISSSSGKLQEKGKFAFTVTIKVSKENLKKLLLENNLFYNSKGAFCILPVISFTSYFGEKKEKYSWWQEDELASLELKSIAGSFFELLSKEFIKFGFYVVDPIFQRVKEGAPSFVIPKSGKSIKSFLPMSEFYTCDIILSGRIHTGKISEVESNFFSNLFSFKETSVLKIYPTAYFIRFSLNVSNIKTRQFLFNVKRKFSFSPVNEDQPKAEVLLRSKDILDSVIYQLAASNEEGSLVLNRLMISVQGPLSYAEREQLQKSLIKRVHGIEDLQVRMLNSSRVVYEAKSSQSVQELSKELKSVSLSHFFIQVKGYRNHKLEIYAKKRNR